MIRTVAEARGPQGVGKAELHIVPMENKAPVDTTGPKRHVEVPDGGMNWGQVTKSSCVRVSGGGIPVGVPDDGH